MDDLISEFIIETQENLDELEADLVHFHDTPNDNAVLDKIFRLMHTIKGSCGFIKLPRLEKLAHHAENVLGRFRDGDLDVRPEYIAVIFQSIARIKFLIHEIEITRSEPKGDDADLIAHLDAAFEGRDLIGVDAFSTLPLRRSDKVPCDLQGLLRMQPMGNAWLTLPYIVHDLSVRLDKKIELEMRGHDLEINSQTLKMIKAPLIHLVRNCADHGLEMPADRVAAGKSEVGHIVLEAYHQGDEIVIKISDDGRGLSEHAIKTKILQHGLAREDEVENMSKQQIQNFIFKPGFSTAERVTAISGRGVGMDVVRANVEKIGGVIDLVSVEGHGSHFTIRIPC